MDPGASGAWSKSARGPRISVEIVGFRPFYILGVVQKPGEYDFRPGLTVMQAVSIAGGVALLLPADVCVRSERTGWPQVFERFGADGARAWERVLVRAHELGLLVIGDVKRGDIGSTAEAYAEAHYRHCDALTVSLYLGGDSLRPFLDRCRDDGRGLFVLVRTSNPGADTIQSLALPGGETVAERVARAVDRWGEETSSTGGFSHVGAVVGATRPAELARLRRLMPRAVLLIPGVGAQGGRVEDCAAAFDGRGFGGLVNQSRGILQCFDPAASDWREQVAAAARTFAADLRNIQGGTVSP